MDTREVTLGLFLTPANWTSNSLSDLGLLGVQTNEISGFILISIGCYFLMRLIVVYLMYYLQYFHIFITYVKLWYYSQPLSSDPQTILRQRSLVSNFMVHGSTYLRAMQQAIGALEGTIVRQTFLLSYMDAFLLLAILNACCIPLVVLTIKKRTVAKAGKVVVPDAH